MGYNRGGRKTRVRRVSSRKKYKKKLEYSKIIVAICGLAGIYIIALTSYVVITTGDTSPLAYLIPAVFTAVSAGLSFYFYKAKRENELKILKSEGKDTYKELNSNTNSQENYYNNENYPV